MEDLVNLCPQDEARVQAIHKEIDIFDCLATSYLDREYLKILKHRTDGFIYLQIKSN